MAFTSYSDLKTAIANWTMGRTDLTDYLDDFIDKAEARFNRELRVREMETTDTLTPSSGEVTLPTDYLEWRRVTALTNPRRVLEYATTDWLDAQYPTRSSGYPKFFTVEGSVIRFLPTTTSDIQLLYYAQIPALSDSNTSNWLLAKAPGLYLHACLMEAGDFIQDDAFMAKHGARYQQEMAALVADDRGQRWARGASRIKGVTP